MGLLTELFEASEGLVERWRAEADEREARARNPVVGVVEREREEAADRAEDAERRLAAGQRQVQCRRCGLWATWLLPDGTRAPGSGPGPS